MNSIKKLIFKTQTDLTLPPDGTITIQGEDDALCYKTASIRVRTTVPVKVNMTGIFGTGGSYYIDTGYRSTNIVDEVISTNTTYQFGIYASNGGTLVYNSSINFTVNDFTTDDQISTFTLTRNHDGDPC